MRNRFSRMESVLLLAALVFSLPMAQALDLDAPPSDADKAAFDNILVPVLKIYNFIKYSASVIAVIAMLFAGISYMTSGNDPKKRETSKNIASYVVIGLVIIWAAPFAGNMLI